MYPIDATKETFEAVEILGVPGLFTPLRVDRANCGGGEVRDCLTALSPTPLSDGGGYSALIGGEGA